MVEPAGHPQVHDERAAGVEPEQEVLPTPPHTREALAVELHPHLPRVVRRRQPSIPDVDVGERSAGDARSEPPAHGLDLG